MLFCVAGKSRVIDGPAVRWKELFIEPPRGYIFCGERYADDWYVCTTSVCYRSEFAFTEGVWMSVTPTDDELIVALDFEGWLISPSPILTDDPTKFQA
jgi:hypothetical protein